jgi:hypothetical protein
LVRQMLRSSLWPLVVALGVLAQPSHAQAPANAVPVKTYTGYFNNTAVYFTAFETNSSNFASVNGLVYAPRLSNANAAGVDNMIFFSNGAAGQTVVLQSEPGLQTYSPLHHVLMASWSGAGTMPLITSYAAAVQLFQAGQLAIQSTGIVFNGPVIVINRPLGVVGGGQLAPTISPNEFAGINPSARTAFFVGHQGYYGGQVVTFLALEHAPGEISMAPGASPVSTIDLNHLGHAAVANFFVAPGQLPLLDSFPAGVTVTTPATTPPATGIAGVSGSYASIAGKAGPLPVAGVTGQTPVAGATGQLPVAGATGQTPVSGVTGTTGQLPVAGATGQTPVSGVTGSTGQLPVAGATGTTGQTPVSGVTGSTGQLPVAGATGTTGQLPVSGTTGQLPVGGVSGGKPVAGESGGAGTLPVFSLPPYQGLYSPIWHVHQVMSLTGTPQVLTSLQALASALSSGLVTQVDGPQDATFNCPIVAVGQSFIQPGVSTTTPTTGGTVTTPVAGSTGTTPVTGGTVTTPVGGTTGTGY